MSSECAASRRRPATASGIPGKALAAQREAMGWTVEQVADQLKLAVRQVVALEAGDYAALPGPAVTRGFVRAYAKLVKLDPAPLVAQIAMDTPPTPGHQRHRAAPRKPGLVFRSRIPEPRQARALPLGWIAGAVVVARRCRRGLAFRPGAASRARGRAGAASACRRRTGAGRRPPAKRRPCRQRQRRQDAAEPAVPLISVPASRRAPAGRRAGAAPARADRAGQPRRRRRATSPAAPATAPGASRRHRARHRAADGPAGRASRPPRRRQRAGAERARGFLGRGAPRQGRTPLISRLVKAGSTETVDVDRAGAR